MADIQRQIAAHAQAKTEQSPRSARGRRTAEVRHGCPGDCGLTVPVHQLACPACWAKLPGPMRQRVTVAYSARRRDQRDPARAAEHRQAMTAAIAWYRDQHRRTGA